MKKQTHKTEDEMLFIETIGQHSEQTKVINKTNILRNYIKSLSLRKDWFGLDKNKIVNFANEELRKEMGYVI